MLSWLSDYRQKNIALKSQCKKALYYPLFVFIIAMLISLGLLLFVIPRFQTIFTNFHTKLPLITTIILQCSLTLQHHSISIFLSGILLFLLIRMAINNHYFKRYLEQAMLKIPSLKNAMTLSITTMWSQITATMITAGTPLITALNTATKITTNQLIQKKLSAIITSVTSGNSLHSAMKETKLFTPSIIQMILVAESTGTLANMLSNIANQSEQELNELLNTYLKLLEPLTMILLALITGALIAGLYLPIIRLGSAF